MRDKSVPLKARHLLDLMSILGLEEEAKVLVCTRKEQGVQRDGASWNGVKCAGSHIHNVSAVGLEGKVASDYPYVASLQSPGWPLTVQEHLLPSWCTFSV